MSPFQQLWEALLLPGPKERGEAVWKCWRWCVRFCFGFKFFVCLVLEIFRFNTMLMLFCFSLCFYENAMFVFLTCRVALLYVILFFVDECYCVGSFWVLMVCFCFLSVPCCLLSLFGCFVGLFFVALKLV